MNQPIVYPRPKAPVKMVSWWASIQANCSIIKIPDTEQSNFMTEEKGSKEKLYSLREGTQLRLVYLDLKEENVW